MKQYHVQIPQRNYKNENYAKLVTSFQTFHEYMNTQGLLKLATMKAVAML
jgi:hypothetical protein